MRDMQSCEGGFTSLRQYGGVRGDFLVSIRLFSQNF